jgi:hypothetical protein
MPAGPELNRQKRCGNAALRQCRAAAGDIRLYALPAAESLICQAT